MSEHVQFSHLESHWSSNMTQPVLSHSTRAFMERNRDLETPFLVIDLDIIEARYRALREALPKVACYYAVKCNSAPPVIRRLHELGSRFEAASLWEIEVCIAGGVAPGDIHFGNTIKKESHIRRAHELGVHSYTCDSRREVEKVARAAPGSSVSCRLATDGVGAVWGLCRKFGQTVDQIVDLVTHAHDLGLVTYGVSFHVGSQQSDPGAWRRAIADAAQVIHILEKQGIALHLINLGGGFPTPGYGRDERNHEKTIRAYGEEIQQAIDDYLPEGIQCVMEPGRYIAASAGVITTEVITLLDKFTDGQPVRWVYLDVGRFNGLWEANDITFPVQTSRDGDEMVHAVLAGPTCDSEDVLYDVARDFYVPRTLDVGDRMIFFNTGAYTRSYTTVGFNGFPPLREFYVSSRDSADVLPDASATPLVRHQVRKAPQ